ncbi:MAG: hypothetical protein CSA36_00355 [Draconibacterium sp.]|nr:MAG: hypothetical protein CSA36_00355 [Draconibacterium sp.]
MSNKRILLCEKRSQYFAFAQILDRFTLTELQILYEVILSKSMYISNFRKKTLNMKLLAETNFEQENVAHHAVKFI